MPTSVSTPSANSAMMLRTATYWCVVGAPLDAAASWFSSIDDPLGSDMDPPRPEPPFCRRRSAAASPAGGNRLYAVVRHEQVVHRQVGVLAALEARLAHPRLGPD